MAEDIGYQDGIEAFETWFRKLSVAIDDHNNWVAEFKAWDALPDEVKKLTDIPIPRTFPKIPLEGRGYEPETQSTWPWVKKFFDNTMRKLKDDHDAAINPVPPPTDPTDPPPPNTDPSLSGYAPQSYNRGSRGQDARYNIRINCQQRSDGKYVDRQGVLYSDGGLCEDGRRSGQYVEGLKPSDMMDGKEPWEPYEWQGRTIPPYPAKSWER